MPEDYVFNEKYSHTKVGQPQKQHSVCTQEKWRYIHKMLCRSTCLHVIHIGYSLTSCSCTFWASFCYNGSMIHKQKMKNTSTQDFYVIQGAYNVSLVTGRAMCSVMWSARSKVCTSQAHVWCGHVEMMQSIIHPCMYVHSVLVYVWSVPRL